MKSVFITTGGAGTWAMERPSSLGRFTGPSDLDDNHISARFSSRVGSFSAAPDGYLVQSGDLLEFDIMLPAPETGSVSPPPPGLWGGGIWAGGAGPGGTGSWTDDTARTQARMGLDLKFLGGPWFSDVPVIDSVSGIEIAYGDKLPIADNVWAHMRAALTQFAGMTLDRFEVCCDEDAAFRYVMLLRDIVISRAGQIVHTIFNGFANPLQTAVNAATDGVYGGYKVDYGFVGDFTVFGDIIGDNIIGPYVSPSVTILSGTTYTVPITVGTVYNNSATGNMTATLYLAGAVPAGRRITFINLHATNTLTVSRAGTNTIDGATTKGPYGQYLGVTLESDGSSTFHVVP